MEPVEVTARWDVEGSITPLQFVWKGCIYQVESTGRQWGDAAGRHVLAMVPGGQVYELIFQPESLRWFLGFRGQNPALV